MGCLNSKPENVVSPLVISDKKSSTQSPVEQINNAAIPPFIDELICYTKKQIAEHNAKYRKTLVLVPIHGKIYNLNQMYTLVLSSDLDLKPRYASKAAEELEKVKKGESSYLSLIATCKYLDVKREILEDIKVKSIKGTVVNISKEEEEQDFQNSVISTLADAEDGLPPWYKEHLERLIDKGKVFEDKQFTAVTGYQGDTQFPLLPWIRTVHLRNHLWPSYWTREWPSKKARDVIEREIKEGASATIESINQINYEKSNDHQCYDDDDDDETGKIKYQDDYWNTFLKCCQFQLNKCTMLIENHPKAGTDINTVVFVPPTYVNPDELRLFLKYYIPFDMDPPSDGFVRNHMLELNIYKTDPSEVERYFADLVKTSKQSKLDCDFTKDGFDLENIFKDTADELEVHNYFADLIGQRGSFDTSLEIGCAWVEIEMDVIKNDKTTSKQDILLKSRGERTDMEDKERMKKRRNTLAKRFMSSYEEPYKGWADRLERSFVEFEELCEGKWKPVPREKIDQKALKEESYQLAISQVKPLTNEERLQKQTVRENILNGFIKRNNLSMVIYDHYMLWGERMEENEKKLQELCEVNHEIEQKIKERNYSVNNCSIFTPYDTFGSTPDLESGKKPQEDQCEVNNETELQTTERKYGVKKTSIYTPYATHESNSDLKSGKNPKEEQLCKVKLQDTERKYSVCVNKSSIFTPCDTLGSTPDLKSGGKPEKDICQVNSEIELQATERQYSVKKSSIYTPYATHESNSHLKSGEKPQKELGDMKHKTELQDKEGKQIVNNSSIFTTYDTFCN